MNVKFGSTLLAVTDMQKSLDFYKKFFEKNGKLIFSISDIRKMHKPATQRARLLPSVSTGGYPPYGPSFSAWRFRASRLSAGAFPRKICRNNTK